MQPTTPTKLKNNTSSLEDFDEQSYVYFTKEHQKAIIDFLDERIPISKRNLIYRDMLYPTFEEMIKIIINTFDFKHTGEDEEFLIVETQNHIYEALMKSMFDESKGSAYTYFSRVIKNFLIQKQKKFQDNQRKYGLKSINDDESYYIENYYDESDDFDIVEFYNVFMKWFNRHYLVFVEKDKEDERLIIETIKMMLSDDSSVINNKKLFIFKLKEITKKEHYKINKVLNKLRDKYFKIKSIYSENYTIDYNNDYER